MTHPATDVRLRLAKLTAVFCSLVAGVYAAASLEPAPVVALFLSGAPLLAVGLWLQEDAQHRRIGAVQDLGYFLILAWPIVIPWYAFRSRGRAGWTLLGGLMSLVLAPFIASTTIPWVIYGIRYAVWYLQTSA